MDVDAVLAARLARQRLTGAPAATPLQVVAELLCVQAQDAPLARAMIALRCPGADDAAVRAAVARGEIVRTHILRPTWHYVAASDLRWLLRLTSPKVESGMAARHRLLELSPTRVSAGLAVLAERLAGLSFVNRQGLGVALAESGVLTRATAGFGEQVGHLLLLAELRGLICSAPIDLAEHHYALVDEVVPATPELDRTAAIDMLVERFVTGHGPVSLNDLTRWARVTLGEARAAVQRLGDRVSPLEVAGEELWHSPVPAAASRPARAWLLSTFDEAFLSYRRVPWPRSAQHPQGANPYRFAEAGGGVVLLDLRDIGRWVRTRSGDRPRIRLETEALPRSGRAAVDSAVDRLLAAIGQDSAPSIPNGVGADA